MPRAQKLAVHRLFEQDFDALNSNGQNKDGQTIDLGPSWGVSFY